ncbi:MAG: pyridoxamine 5-phosphate oxidase, partial [Rhodobacteraceae bacterium]|nr:pyridoxamine 5-phosphate oxidase [Paracoccaceae bacterium]
MPKPDHPIFPADKASLALARRLLSGSATAALAFSDPDNGLPAISRIGFGLDHQRQPLTLLSDLASHSRALRARPDCALLLGDPGPKGDPMASPRLSLAVQARFLLPDDPSLADLRQSWLSTHPKAQLYIGFADFHFVRFTVTSAFLNGGFGRATRLT